jgi:hypothetical protein
LQIQHINSIVKVILHLFHIKCITEILQAETQGQIKGLLGPRLYLDFFHSKIFAFLTFIGPFSLIFWPSKASFSSQALGSLPCLPYGQSSPVKTMYTNRLKILSLYYSRLLFMSEVWTFSFDSIERRITKLDASPSFWPIVT